ncbi:carbonate dehydratase, eukaryotic-type [Necator americanus]|uniref:Carbonic anhydrase n=1 Tax=Necator americanus TaxID=51031 RepID=W2TSS6_NECAM|nr:carbonate dehydratase, eukaryotic-type [Necator americanus]ETN85140.1 carbonate dehydratase, eukaryotic-type [Necator americanus]
MYRSLFASTKPQNRQSPINISTKETIYDPEKCKRSSIKFHYNEGDCHELVALPTTWMLKTISDCKTTFSASHLPAEFRLLQIHGHWGTNTDCGSEHSIDDKRFAAEVHFVFWNTNYDVENASNYPDGMAVLAVFLTESKYNQEYGHITGVISEAINTNAPVSISKQFDMTKLIPKGKHQYDSSSKKKFA